MNNTRLSGILQMLSGLLTILVPTVLLPVCQGVVQTAAGTTVPMRCYYTAQASIALGALIFIVGGTLFFARQAESRGLLNLIALALGAAVILVPTVLIGTCKNPDMACNIGAKPGLLLLGSIVMILGAVGIWQARRSALANRVAVS